MKKSVLIGLAAAGASSVASAEVLTFAHTFEVVGRLNNTALGTADVPYQSMHGEANIAITEGVMPVAYTYAYESDPEFHVSLDAPRTDFAVLFRSGHGRSEVSEMPGMWNLFMEYMPVAIIGDVEYRMAGDDAGIRFIRPHQDPQPLPVEGGDEEELRHGTPVVFLIESPIVLWANGDANSQSSFTIDTSSRLLIESAVVPGPGTPLLAGAVLVLAVRRRRQN